MPAKKSRTGSGPEGAYFQFLLTPADRERIGHLAGAFGTTKSDAIRRAVELTYERQVQGLLGTQLDLLIERVAQVSDRVGSLEDGLLKVRERTGNAIEVTRAAELALKGIAGEARANSATAALLLRAMVNTLKSRPEIEAEVTRLLQEASRGRLPEAE